MKNPICQGDVVFIPSKFKTTGLDQTDNPVVQHGEATGHAHRLSGGQWEFYSNPKTKTRHLRVVEPSDLLHEEHHTVTLPPGDYEVRIVREYNHFEEEARQVAD